MFTIAQTNVQLFNQLQRNDWEAEDFALVRRGYELAMRLYAGHFQADGKPFVSHCVGVASVMVQLGMPAPVVAAACVHNIYGNGDFGDGLEHCVTPFRRKVVRDAVGHDVEALVTRFRELRQLHEHLRQIGSRLNTLSKRDRQLVAMDLADTLELYTDLGVLYFGDNKWLTDYVGGSGDWLVEIAERLGHIRLAEALSRAFAAAAKQSVPSELRSGPQQQYLSLVMPMSCARRPGLVARRLVSRLRFSTRSARERLLGSATRSNKV